MTLNPTHRETRDDLVHVHRLRLDVVLHVDVVVRETLVVDAVQNRNGNTLLSTRNVTKITHIISIMSKHLKLSHRVLYASLPQQQSLRAFEFRCNLVDLNACCKKGLHAASIRTALQI